MTTHSNIIAAADERLEKYISLSSHLPPLISPEQEIWVWSKGDKEILRAACAVRFGEDVRTETLFTIAAAGIRIFKHRLQLAALAPESEG